MHLGRMRLVCRHRQEIRGRAASQVPASAVGPHSGLLFVPKRYCVGGFERVRIDNNGPLRVESRLSEFMLVSKSPSRGPMERLSLSLSPHTDRRRDKYKKSEKEKEKKSDR